MESIWNTVLTNSFNGSATWFEVVQPATFTYFRWIVDTNKFYKWFPGTQLWTDVTATIATIIAAGALSVASSNSRQV